MIATNALVTWDNLSVMGLTPKYCSGMPTGLKIVTKGDANAYYWLDNSVSPFSTYTNLRCPRYQDIVPLANPFRSYRVTTDYSGTWYYTDCCNSAQSQHSNAYETYIFACAVVNSVYFVPDPSPPAPPPPPVICVIWQATDYGWATWTDCDGYPQYTYLNPWDSICVQNGVSVIGPAYNTGSYCP